MRNIKSLLIFPAYLVAGLLKKGNVKKNQHKNNKSKPCG
jgi:hypothetical protein